MASRFLINTGPGKGKTTAAFGLALRALGHGMRVCVFQFIKGKLPSGEVEAIARLGAQVHRLGRGFTWRSEDLAQDRAAALEGWQKAAAAISSGEWDLVVLDEVNIALAHGFLEADQVARVIAARPERTHVVATGRGLDARLAELADTITEFNEEKHAYRSGVKAVKGVEF